MWVHGLTRAKLAGAPSFDGIVDALCARLDGRVFVAHNARFDLGFLQAEAAGCDRTLPITGQLCTAALARRLDLPVADVRLATLAGYFRVPHRRAHDALADAEALTGVAGACLALAAAQGIPLPLLTGSDTVSSRARRPPCPYRNPGRLRPGGPLVQGMRLAFTGETRADRDELTARAIAAGLHVTGSVSAAPTSLLVTNTPASGTGKARTAARHGTPVVSEAAFLQLLGGVAAGEPAAATAAVPEPRRPSDQPQPARYDQPRRDAGRGTDPDRAPLHGERVLVLGGPHVRAARGSGGASPRSAPPPPST